MPARVLWVCLAMMMAGAVPAIGGAAPATADEASTVARNLAENILGKGLVRTSRVSADGRSLTMTWDSATFKPAHTAEHMRDLLRVEAQLTWGAITQVLVRIENFDFEILNQNQALCSGAVVRRRPMTITYAPRLRP
jgi:hypothetical protein